MTAAADSSGSPARVVIAGGGIAGLEALLALHDLAGDRAELVLVAPQPGFTYRPLIVEEPFSHQPAEERDLAAAVAEIGGTFVHGAVTGVDAAARTLKLADGSELGYDKAVIAVGGRPHPPFSRAITFRDAGDSLQLETLLGGSADEGGPSVAFVVPPGASWALPLYELALMTERRARESGKRLQIRVVTPEDAPLIAFGTRGSEAVAELLAARGIELTTARHVEELEGGELVLKPGDEPLAADHVVSLPVLEGPALEGLPSDEHGFIPIDEHCRVRGEDDLYAAGDGTNFPIKQGGLGTQQADAAAEHLAAALGADMEAEGFHPVLRGMLLTGSESLSLRHSLTGGAGEGDVSSDYLWWPPQKVGGRYLAPWLHGATPHADLEPPPRSLDVEVALPKEWHQQPMALDPLRPIDGD